MSLYGLQPDAISHTHTQCNQYPYYKHTNAICRSSQFNKIHHTEKCSWDMSHDFIEKLIDETFKVKYAH